MDAAPTAQAGRGRPKQKRKANKDAAAAAEKKRRTTRASRQPVAPPSINLNCTHTALNNFDATTIASILRSNNSAQVASALNGLLRASSDLDVNYCLGFGGEQVLTALVKLFDEAIGWEEGDEVEVPEKEYSSNLEPTVKTWDASSLRGKRKRWRCFCRDKLASPLTSSSDPNLLIDEAETKLLEMVVAILRNLSYVAQNLRFLYHSEEVLRVLTGALYYRGYGVGSAGSGEDRLEDSPSSSHQSNMCVHSIHALINMAPLIDVTGRQIFIDRMFIESGAKEIVCTVPGQNPNPDDGEPDGAAATTTSMTENGRGRQKYGLSSFLGFGGMNLAKRYDAKAGTLENIPNSEVWGLDAGSHVRTVLAIFPALLAALDPDDITSAHGWHRPSVQAVLELLAALIENSDNKGLFLCVPDVLLHRLASMLFMPRLGPDSMDYIDPVSNVVTRVVALKLRMGYDSTIDSDMRDRACDLLVKLTDSTSCAGRLVYLRHHSSSRRMNVRLYDSLLSMLSSTSGRGDAGPLAARLLSNLALVPGNKGILYVERKLIAMSAKDPRIANIAFNGIFNRIK